MTISSFLTFARDGEEWRIFPGFDCAMIQGDSILIFKNGTGAGNKISIDDFSKQYADCWFTRRSECEMLNLCESPPSVKSAPPRSW
jgi:hypothetical protein